MGLQKRQIAGLAGNTPAVVVDPAIVLENVLLKRGERTILNGINWQLPAGGCGAIVGPNGSGKSTLMRMLAGYVWPTSGTVRVLGHKLGEFPVAELRRAVAIVESLGLYSFDEGITVRQVVCTGFFGSLTLAYDEPTRAQLQHCDQLLAQFHIFPRRDQAFFTLSTGERMRTLLARALVNQPKLLLLDEPSNGLDLPTRESLLSTLTHLRSLPNPPAVVMVSHFMEEILPDTQCVLLLNGAGAVVACGEPRKVLNSIFLSAAFDWPIKVRHHKGRFFAHSSPRQ